jgi:ribosome-associated protein
MFINIDKSDCLAMIHITSDISLEDNEIRLEFIHSSGPGGQNVNKVATAVKLYFDIINSPSLAEAAKKRLITLGGKRVTQEGILIIDARRYRTQERNRQDAIERIKVLIRKAVERPKKRKKTKPTEGSREKRLKLKHLRGEKKQLRKVVDPFEE